MGSTSSSESGTFPRGGYTGRILVVDLSTGAVRIQQLDESWARTHVGGLGFGARVYLDAIKNRPSFDALSPDNPFVIMTGPLTGMRMHAVARWTVATKSPLTDYWGDANIGGYFGARLKFAGYDGIVLTGAAPSPVYLHIDDDRVEVRDAARYWGQDIYTVTDNMVADHKSESSRAGEVFAIGPAGENLVRIATITNRKGHTAGRAGLGAVWGAKNLKAIFVRGSGNLDAAFPDRLRDLRRELDQVYRNSILIEALRSMGTPSQFDVGVILGDVPMKNWQLTDWERFDEIGPSAYAERILTGNKTCYACGVACKREAEVKDGVFRFAKGPGPEYETVCAFGPLCLNPDIESIGKANELCNRYGLDTISCGATIAFAIECFENGLITEQDTDGLRLTWGNFGGDCRAGGGNWPAGRFWRRSGPGKRPGGRGDRTWGSGVLDHRQEHGSAHARPAFGSRSRAGLCCLAKRRLPQCKSAVLCGEWFHIPARVRRRDCRPGRDGQQG
jgi:aldehyde:ferredoxin oxidoreductase